MPRYKLVTTRTRTQAPSRAHNGHGKRSDRAPFARAAAYERARCAAIKKDPRPRRAEIPRPMGNTICARAAVATQRHIVIATQREKHKQRNMAIATQRHILIATQREENKKRTTIVTQRQRVIATQREKTNNENGDCDTTPKIDCDTTRQTNNENKKAIAATATQRKSVFAAQRKEKWLF